MSDIISREGAILAILETESKVARETPYDSEVFSVMAKRQNEILDVLFALPSADRPTGRWISDDLVGWKCSACGSHIVINIRIGNYCPWCGAKMEGGEEE